MLSQLRHFASAEGDDSLDTRALTDIRPGMITHLRVIIKKLFVSSLLHHDGGFGQRTAPKNKQIQKFSYDTWQM